MIDGWALVAILAKLMLYVGVTGATGLVMMQIIFADLVAPLRARLLRQAQVLAGIAVAAAGLGFAVRGAALTGGVDGMTDPEMLGLLWQTPVGDALSARVIGSALMIAGLFVPRVGAWIALLGGVIALWSFATIGHVPDLQRPGLRVMLMGHLLGVAFWVGVLGPLYALARCPEHLARAASLGHRFGQIATFVVPLLILAGGVMAWMLLGDLRSLVTTGYGQTLLVKLGLVAGVLALAAANKMRFVPAMKDGDSTAASQLTRSIQIEAVIILAVLAATATLTSALPLPT